MANALTVPEFAARLGVSERTVWRMIADETIIPFRYKRTVRIGESWLLEAIGTPKAGKDGLSSTSSGASASMNGSHPAVHKPRRKSGKRKAAGNSLTGKPSGASRLFY